LSSITQLLKTNVNLIFAAYAVCLHEQNKSRFFGEPTFIHPIRAI